MRHLVTALALVLVVGALSHAAEIRKTDGSVIEGKIVAETETTVTIRMQFGEVVIPKSDIESIEREAAPSPEHQLFLLQEQTIGQLEALAKEADAAGRTEDAAALREIVREVELWTLDPAERAERPAAPRVQRPKTLDFSRVRAKIASLDADPGTTKAQLDAYLDEVNNQPGRARVEILDSKTGYKGALIMTCEVDGFKVQVTFTDPAEIEQALKIRKGSRILVEGTIRTRGIPVSLVADIMDARLR